MRKASNLQRAYVRPGRGNAMLVLALASGAALASGSRALGQEYPVTDGQGISIAQTDVETAPNTNDDTNAAGVEINSSTLISDLSGSDGGLTTGYLNVADSSGNWIMQNVPVDPTNMPELQAGMPLSTPDGTNEAGQKMQFSMDLSANPVQTFAPGAGGSTFTLGSEEDDAAGAAGAAGVASINLPGSLTFGDINSNPRRVARLNNYFTTKNGNGLLYNVNAANNQCTTAAFSNEITYLAINKGLALSYANNPGRGDPSTGKVYYPTGGGLDTQGGNALVSQLDLTCQRASVSRTSGSGTFFSKMVPGAMQYFVNNNQTFVTVTSDSVNGNIPLAQATIGTYSSVVDATDSFVDFGYNQLNNGSTVEFNFGYPTSTGGGHHSVNLVATGSIAGQSWVFYDSDLKQTDTDLQDVNLSSGGGAMPIFSWVYPQAGGSSYLYNNTGPVLWDDSISFTATAAPEPCTVGVLGMLSIGLLGRRKRGSQTR
jgi:hypothetical protein